MSKRHKLPLDTEKVAGFAQNDIQNDNMLLEVTKLRRSRLFYQYICLLLSVLLISLLFVDRVLWDKLNYDKLSPLSSSLKSIKFTKSDLYTTAEKHSEAKRLFNKAATFSGESGEGRQGWMHLLAAFSYDNTNLEVVSNLVSNYEALNYGVLGYTALIESNISQNSKNAIMPIERQQQLHQELQIASDSIKATSDPGNANTSILFATAVSRWDMTDLLPPRMNSEIYNHSVREYERLKSARPDLSATDLNHAFFRVQMAKLDTTSSYWGPFKDIDGFPTLVASMRRCVWTFLKDYHGWTEDIAMLKSSHPLVVWVSVHTAESVHQPHVTEDALVGGVYYVSVPDGSGKLHMYDPRGKHPMHDLKIPTSPPNPPFHRIVSLAPSESLLVLFPGWLVHSVGSGSVNAFPSVVNRDGQEIKYRVSLSLNLKGEWSDTAGAAYGAPTYDEIN